MKYTIAKPGYLLLIMAILSITCKPNPVEKLSKKWKPVDVTGDDVTAETKKSIIKEGNVMEFSKDGKFISFSAERSADTGSYKLSEDGKVLTIHSSNNRETKINVTELRANRLIIDNHGLVLVLEPAK